jgi:hypothetical protein
LNEGFGRLELGEQIGVLAGGHPVQPAGGGLERSRVVQRHQVSTRLEGPVRGRPDESPVERGQLERHGTTGPLEGVLLEVHLVPVEGKGLHALLDLEIDHDRAAERLLRRIEAELDRLSQRTDRLVGEVTAKDVSITVHEIPRGLGCAGDSHDAQKRDERHAAHDHSPFADSRHCATSVSPVEMSCRLGRCAEI